MNQWEIAEKIYEKVSELVIKEKNDICKLKVKDICQTACDKNGQKIIVDEQMYEQPAMFEMCLSIGFVGDDYIEMLRKYCEIAVFLKDNPAIERGDEFKWHGMTGNVVFLEPVVRKLDSADKKDKKADEKIELLYKVGFGLNSQKAFGFKRIEKREIRGLLK